MHTASPEVDWVSRPANLTDFYRQYQPCISAIVRKRGIADWEDATSEIICRFVERGFLDKFDPDYVTVVGGRHYPARFKTFVEGFASTYCMGMRDRERRHLGREQLIADAPVGTEDDDTRWIDTQVTEDSRFDEVESVMSSAVVVAGMARQIARLPKSSRRDLSEFFAAALAQLSVEEELDRSVLAEKMSVSVSSIGNWIHMVRSEVEPWRDQLR